MQPRIVVLPGTDGTGLMLESFVHALPASRRTLVVEYPRDRALGYAGLHDLVLSALPAEPFILVGESFGGPLAISIAATKPQGLVALVLCASFASFPSHLARLLAPAASFAPVRPVPTALLAWLLLGRWSTPELCGQLRRSLELVAPSALRARVVAALRVDASAALSQLTVPILYLRATSDRVVPRAASTMVLRHAKAANVVEVAGPHFLLQAAPQACAQAIERFAAGL